MPLRYRGAERINLENFGGCPQISPFNKEIRQLIDGESKGKTMATQLVKKAQKIEAILGRPRTSEAEIAEWKNEMICAVESEARNAGAIMRIVEFLKGSEEVRAAVADLQSGDSFRVAVGDAQLLVRNSGVVTDNDDDFPFDDMPF